MKKLFLFIGIVAYTLTATAQISNLTDMASGKMQGLFTLYENEQTYGYMAMFYLGQTGAETEKYSYVLFDKNLNKVNNGEFTDNYYKGFNKRYITAEKVGDKIMLTKQIVRESLSTIVFTENRMIDINDKEHKEVFYLDNDIVMTGKRSLKKIRKNQRRKEFLYFPVVADGGFLIFQVPNPQNVKIPRKFSYYKEGEIQWTKDIDTKRGLVRFAFEFSDDKRLYLRFTERVKGKKRIYLRSYDIATGEEFFNYQMSSGDKSEYAYKFYSVERLDEATVIVGMMSDDPQSKASDIKTRGFFKIVLNKKGEELSKKYYLWNQITDFQVNDQGKLDKGYKVFPKEFFVFKDGSVSVLTEKLKPTYNFMAGSVVPKNTDFIIFNFNKDLQLINTETIAKDVTKFSSSDYLYSQKIKDGNGVVFFYRDYKKDETSKKKNWVLGIVTLINAKVNIENIPMSSEEHFIYPYRAKEGFILLREINKDGEYDQIRLERINY